MRAEEQVSGTWAQHMTRAILLDLADVRSHMQGVHECMGEGTKEDARLSIVGSDLMPDLDSVTARIQAALDAARGAEAGDGA